VNRIEEIERRLRELAVELGADDTSDERASELVQEAARLVTEAGEEVSRALASPSRDTET
jgi:hypothetical protein